jgi:hypothetical protein
LRACNTPVLHMHSAPANHEHKHCHAFINIAWNNDWNMTLKHVNENMFVALFV